MSEEIKNLTDSVMKKIHEGKIKMKPKTYFIVGSFLTFVGLISAIIISAFSISLIRFSLRAHGPMAQYKLSQMMSNFPWLILIFSIIGLILGIYLIKKYEFSYKIKPWIVISGFILAIFIAGYAIDLIGFNDMLYRKERFKKVMDNPYFRKHMIMPPNSINKNIKNSPRMMKNSIY